MIIMRNMLTAQIRRSSLINLTIRPRDITARKLSTADQAFVGIPVTDSHLTKFIAKLKDELNFIQLNDNNVDNATRQLSPILSRLIAIAEKRDSARDNIKSLNEMARSSDEEMLKLIEQEKTEMLDSLNDLERDFTNTILLMDKSEASAAAILEVTAGVGGQEAMLFARELFDMYTGYANYMCWNTEIIQLEHTDIGGIRHASILIEGESAYRLLHNEAGVHRVQRIPATEKSGRVHTSTVSVAVTPKLNDLTVTIRDKDIRVETKRATGAGGQHVNTTDSAVRIHHLPTGIAVECQAERSQLKNREVALRKLQLKLYQLQYDEQQRKLQASRKAQVGTRMRNEKIRTYNFNQDRVTDHRIEGGTMHNLTVFLGGGDPLDTLIQKLDASERTSKAVYIIKSKIA